MYRNIFVIMALIIFFMITQFDKTLIQINTSSIDSMVLSSEELKSIGLPPNSLSQKLKLKPNDVFEGDSYDAQAAKMNVIKGMRYIYYSDFDEETSVGIVLVELANEKLAEKMAKGIKQVNWNQGVLDNENPPFYLQKRDNGFNRWAGITSKGRILVSVFLQENSNKTSFSDEEFSKLGFEIFDNQVKKIPFLEDSLFQKTINQYKENNIVGLSLGTLVFILPILSALFSILGDSGARDRINPFYKRKIKRRFKPKASIIEISGSLTSNLKENIQLFLRSLFLAAVCTIIYIVSGKLQTIGVILVIAGVVLIITCIDLILRVMTKKNYSEIFVTSYSTIFLGFIVVLGGTFVYCFGVLVLLLGIVGVIMYNSTIYIVAGLALIVYGAVILTYTDWPMKLGKRILQPYKKRMVENDLRQEVLLLRSFQDDDLEIRVHSQSRHSFLEQLTLQRLERFEELLVWNLWKIGPVRTIGQPGTILEPLGAVRDYIDDHHWKEMVESKMIESKMVVFLVGRSHSLLWEVSQAKTLGRLGSCLFIVPPVTNSEASKRLQVLSSALGISFDCFGLDYLGETPCPIVAFYFNEMAAPVLIISLARDDISYQAAVKIASQNIDKNSKPIYEPANQFCELSEKNVESLLLKFKKKPKRERNKIFDFITSVLFIILIIGSYLLNS